MPKKPVILRRRKRKRSTKKKLSSSIYDTPEYQQWRARVFSRDKHTCRLCGASKSYIEAHHILRKADFPHLMYTVSNGITLCKPCHNSVTRREYKFVPLFQELLKKRSKPPNENRLPLQTPILSEML